MQKLVAACPALASAPEFRAVMSLKSIDVIATRLWFDKHVPTRYVCQGFLGFLAAPGDSIAAAAAPRRLPGTCSDSDDEDGTGRSQQASSPNHAGFYIPASPSLGPSRLWFNNMPSNQV